MKPLGNQRVYLRSNAAAIVALVVAVLVSAAGIAAAEPGGHAANGALISRQKTKKLPKNSVGTPQLKKNAVNGSKVKDHSLTGADIDPATLGTVPSAANSDTVDGRHAADFLAAGQSAGGALAGAYPNPQLNLSGGPCADGRALTDVSSSGALTCGPGIYVDSSNNVAAVPEPWPNLNPIFAGANAAFGDLALFGNTTGVGDAAFGAFALAGNTIGYGNSAFGQGTMKRNVDGYQNAAFGAEALGSNGSGHDNSAFGHNSLPSNTTGVGNSALGSNALEQSVDGSNNTAVGEHALWQLATGANDLAIGAGAGASMTGGSDNVYIANGGVDGESHAIRIGNDGSNNKAFLAGVAGSNLGANPAVVVNGEGRLGVETSSRRFKTEIRSIGGAAHRLMALRPVSFRYKPGDVHGPRPVQYGLLAEQVAKVYPNLVVRGRAGRPYTVLYQELPSMLLAQVQRQQHRIDRQQIQIERLARRVRGLEEASRPHR